jgi:glycosyltransferase involved in cell wall biosynthesis
LESLKKRAREHHLNVRFAAFDQTISQKLASADLFLHLCPIQFSGLTILEAMAQRVPVMVSDCNGTGTVISHNINGFSFNANDPAHLALRLDELSKAPFNLLNVIAKGGEHLLNIRFSAESGIEKYRRLIWGQKLQTTDLTHGKLFL